jgi:hypothetical protein
LSEDAAVTVTDGSARPEPPYAAPEGRHWVPAPAGREWGIADPGRRCRYRGQAAEACGEPAKVVRTRGIRTPIPWNYCAADAAGHYGVWAEDGKVMTWKLEDD